MGQLHISAIITERVERSVPSHSWRFDEPNEIC